MDNKAGRLLQKYSLHVPGAILPKGHAEQNGSLMVGHHMLAAWFRGMLTDHRAMTAEALTSFHHFSLGQVSMLCQCVLRYRLGCYVQALTELAHTVEFHEFCFHVKFFNNKAWCIKQRWSPWLVRPHFLIMMLWTEPQPSRNSSLRSWQDGRYLVRVSRTEEKVTFLLTLSIKSFLS